MGKSQSSDFGFDDHEWEACWGSDFHLSDALLLEFLEASKAWMSTYSGPDETSIDLLDVVRFLPYVFWYDLTPHDVWVCRFFGSVIVEVRGNDPTKLPLEDAKDNIVDEYVRAFFEVIVKAGEPVSTDSQSAIEGREYLRMQSVGMPVFDDSGKISGVIGAQVFYLPDGKRMG